MIYRLLKRDLLTTEGKLVAVFFLVVYFFSTDGLRRFPGYIENPPMIALFSSLPILAHLLLLMSITRALFPKRCSRLDLVLPIPARELFLYKLGLLVVFLWGPLLLFLLDVFFLGSLPAVSSTTPFLLETAAIFSAVCAIGLGGRIENYENPLWLGWVVSGIATVISGTLCVMRMYLHVTVFNDYFPPSVILVLCSIVTYLALRRAVSSIPPSFQFSPGHLGRGVRETAGWPAPTYSWWPVARVFLRPHVVLSCIWVFFWSSPINGYLPGRGRLAARFA